MADRMLHQTSIARQLEIAGVRRVVLLVCALSFLVLLIIPAIACAQTPSQAKLAGTDPIPKPAIPAILDAFAKYEVVGLPAGHGLEDVDEFILTLIRHPAFSEKVNDIAVECGNSLYQPILDRYIAGEDVPFTEVRKVWRNTPQFMCSTSGFYEQLFPLVRAINQKVPSGKRLRVLACDPPINWDQVKNRGDFPKSLGRDVSAANIMKEQVFAKRRKALMLFGTYHLTHAADPRDPSAVSIYEKDYPNLTLVISDLGAFDTDSPSLFGGPFASWPIPSLALAKGTWLGALDLGQFLPPGIAINKDCNVKIVVPTSMQRPMEDFVDAFLYFGPQDLRLNERMPADIPLDSDYMTEIERREAMSGYSMIGSLKEFDQKILNNAENPLLGFKQVDTKAIAKRCLEQKAQGSSPK